MTNDLTAGCFFRRVESDGFKQLPHDVFVIARLFQILLPFFFQILDSPHSGWLFHTLELRLLPFPMLDRAIHGVVLFHTLSLCNCLLVRSEFMNSDTMATPHLCPLPSRVPMAVLGDGVNERGSHLTRLCAATYDDPLIAANSLLSSCWTPSA